MGHVCGFALCADDRGAADRSLPMLREALSITDEIGSRRMGQCVLEVSSGLAVLCKEWETAARFFGAAEALADQTGLHRDPADEAFLVPRITEACEALMTTVFTSAENAGRALSYQEAIDEARTWLGNFAPAVAAAS